MRRHLPVLGLLALNAVAACAPDADFARQQWLHQTLVVDNQTFLEQSLEFAGGKFAKMAGDPYPYFRGTAPQYTRDAMQPGSPGYTPTLYASADTDDVGLVGDPHPENIGSYARPTADGLMVVADFNDFDGSTYGPYYLDVRRLALGFYVLGDSVQRSLPEDRYTDDDQTAAVAAVVEGYLDELAQLEADPDARTLYVLGGDDGEILEELLEGAVEDGEEYEKLVEYTEVDEDGIRQMLFQDLDPREMATFGDEAFEQLIYGDTTIELTPAEMQQVEIAIGQYRDTLVDPSIAENGALTIKGASRRLGAGVASYPVPRYYVLIEGATEAVEDDVLLELKQTLDPIPLPGLPQFPAPPFGNNGERVIKLQRQMQSFDNNDPWLGYAAQGNFVFRVRHRTGYQRGVRVEKIIEEMQEDDWFAPDVVEYAGHAGRLLARTHATTPRRDGSDALQPLLDAVGSDDGLVDETTAFVGAYGPQILADYDHFLEILDTYGPSLGYRPR